MSVSSSYANGTYDGVQVENDDDGLWIVVDAEAPYWIGPRALRSLDAARAAHAVVTDAETERLAEWLFQEEYPKGYPVTGRRVGWADAPRGVIGMCRVKAQAALRAMDGRRA